ncbi:right-handed parallel beta-helix repeat-containing protein [candidate division KSB1 bacterium]|nr:right-handed parallel beta-helix repeat-containing protein [candidate division KSB1 bacterium]
MYIKNLKRIFRFLILSGLAIRILSPLSSALADTIINAGAVSGTWTESGSPYVVRGDIFVNENSILTINPGVVVRFAKNTRLSVGRDEKLEAVGTEGEIITFTSDANNPVPGDWTGIRTDETEDGVRLKHCIVEYAKTGIYCGAYASGCENWDNKTVIENCIIRYNSDYGIHCDPKASETYGCIGWGADMDADVNAIIQYNSIYENGKDGIYLFSDDGAHNTDGDVQGVIKKNIIYKNKQAGIKAAGEHYIAPQIINNTIVNNGTAGVIFSQVSGHEYTKFVNNIIVNNGTGIETQKDNLTDRDYNNVWNNGTNFQGLSAAVNDISKNPNFISYNQDNFHLKATSPCIDAGDPSSENDPDGTRADMGALYFHQAENITAPNILTGPSRGKVGQTLEFATGGSESSRGHDLEYQFNWGSGNLSDWNGTQSNHVFNGPGVKEVKARARCQQHTEIISDWSAIKTVDVSYCDLMTSIKPQGAGNISINPNKSRYTYNESVQLTPNAASGFQFDHWEGDLGGQNNPATINMNGDKNVEAHFIERCIINVTQPNGGEIWQEDSNHAITWTSDGAGAFVSIFYSFDNGASWNTIISKTENDGTYNWSIPEVNSDRTNSRIKVQDFDSSTCFDISDANFIIIDNVAPPNIVVSPDTLFFTVNDDGLMQNSSGSLLLKGAQKFEKTTIPEFLQIPGNQELRLSKNHPISSCQSYDDTLANIYEGPIKIFSSQYRTMYETTKLVPATACTLKTLRYGFTNPDAVKRSKVCTFFVWRDNSGRPGNELFSSSNNIELGARESVWLTFDITDLNITANGPIWIGHIENSDGFPTSLVDSVKTPGTNFYSRNLITWEEELGDHLHQCIVSYSNPVSENTDMASLMIKNTGGEILNIASITASEKWVEKISASKFNLMSQGEKNVNIQVNAQGLPDNEYSGLLTIISNDPDESFLQVVLDFNIIKPKLFLENEKISMKINQNNTNSEETFSIKNTGRATLEMKNISADVPWLVQASPKKFYLTPDKNQEILLIAQNTENLPDGIYSGLLTLDSNDPVFPKISVGLELQITTFVDNQNTARIPSEFMLHPNYPNPFNPQTNISFDLPVDSDVLINIYNIKGELESELYRGRKSAGTYTLVWNAKTSQSGTYFLKFQANNFSKVEKCILLK